jgi:nucleotide-binding universal stress UspA family protein
MRALIATDLSEASLAAVDAVTSCDPVDFSGIVLVHAVDLDLYTAGGTVPAVLELAEESLGSIAGNLRAAGFEVSVRAEVGPAVEVIERVAAEENADLVVMSNLGKGAVTGRLLGSTAERLATAGKLPVLIERVREDAGAWCRIADSHPFGKVLIGADLTDSLQGQLVVVGNLPGLGQVRVVHVTDPGTDADLVTGELAAHATHRLPGVRVETALREGTDKAEELLAEAAEWGASVIVVSPRSHGILHRALWGSTARTVALESLVPVLFVPLGDGV